MTRKPVLSILFVVLISCFPGVAAPGKTARSHASTQATTAQSASSTQKKPPDNGNLPESASALPLLSAIGAGALLGGLLSARRTRSR